jgi:hypothetical protein
VLRVKFIAISAYIKKKNRWNSKMAARAGTENLHFTLNGEPRRAPGAASGWRPYGVGRCGPGELRSTAVAPQTSLGQSSIAPWTD